jgi:hypothetical protein
MKKTDEQRNVVQWILAAGDLNNLTSASRLRYSIVPPCYGQFTMYLQAHLEHDSHL